MTEGHTAKGLFPGWVLIQWAPILLLLQGALGLDRVLGLASALPRQPGPLFLSCPFPQPENAYHPLTFPSAPLQVGCRWPHHHGNKAGPLPVGPGLSGRWESRSSMSRMYIYERSCGRARYVWVWACVCTWGWNRLCVAAWE